MFFIPVNHAFCNNFCIFLQKEVKTAFDGVGSRERGHGFTLPTQLGQCSLTQLNETRSVSLHADVVHLHCMTWTSFPLVHQPELCPRHADIDVSPTVFLPGNLYT